MAKRIEFVSTADWRGGLNLKADEFLLGADESPDLLNVDVDPRGGFRQRKGVTMFGSLLPAEVRSMWPYATTQGIRQIMVATDSQIWYSTGGNWALAINREGPCRAATFKDRCYIQNGTDPVIRWEGAPEDVVTLGPLWNENLESPTPHLNAGNVPPAKHIAVHLSTMFIANTLEGGVRHPNRLRFSHPNFPEDWRSFDYIDIDIGLDGDEITALVPFQGVLLIFKRRSIHALHGDGPENFRVETVTNEIGTISQEATVATDEGVYFFAWPEGVFKFTDKGPTWVFDRIERAIKDGRIPHAYQDQIQLGWGYRRLWVSVPWEELSTRSRVFVLDSSLSKEGSWVAYDLQVGPFIEWAPPGQNALFLGYGVGRRQVLALDQEADADYFGVTPTPIKARYRTRWYDLGQPLLKKSWKRPEVVMAAGSDAEVYVKVYHDWDASTSKRDFLLNVAADNVNEGGFWDGLNTRWDQSLWSRATASGGHNSVERGAPMGTSRSVSLEFVGPPTPTDWGVGSLGLKYIVKRPRS